MDNLQDLYPHLFRPVIWPWGPTQARFERLERLPPHSLIAHVNIIPQVNGSWVVIQLGDGTWEVPGGTLEPGEDILHAARRELREEAGARLQTLRFFGGWHCRSLAPEPFRPHLPFPEFYRVVGVGSATMIGKPENPSGGEHVSRVVIFTLEEVMQCFQEAGRPDLAELYALGAYLHAR